MAKDITIGSRTYSLPLQGENPSWGEDLSDIIEALANSVNNFQGPSDILESSALISNNVSSPTIINLFQFDSSTVRSFEAQYSIFRKNDSTTMTESGVLVASNDDTIGWSISIMKEGEANVDLDINSSGQVVYTSSDMGGVYNISESKIIFRAKALLK